MRAFVFTVGSACTFMLAIGGTLAFVFAIGSACTFVLSVGSALAFVFTIGSALALVLTISGACTLVLAVGGTLALVLTISGTCTLVLAVGGTLALVLTISGTCTLVLAVGGTLALVSRSGFRFTTCSGIFATGRKFGTGSSIGLEIVGIITQVAHLLANLVGRSFLRIIRHRQLGGCLVIRIILHAFEEGNVLFETIHALLAILGGVGLDGHRGTRLGGGSGGFALGVGTQREDGHKDH